MLAAPGLPNLDSIVLEEGNKKVTATAGSAFDASISPLVSACSLPSIDKSKQFITKKIPKPSLSIAIPKEDTHSPEGNTKLEMGDGAIWKTCLSPRHGCARDASAETKENPIGEEEQCYFNASVKKMRIGGNLSLNSTCSDSIEAPILDLEELANRVKWLKGILEFGVPLSNAGRPQWKFMEDRASSTRK
ncbi:hypothetical protein U1Q18_042204 [Sarracenia purpurea var. burkii]